jgi:hypothetical protein
VQNVGKKNAQSTFPNRALFYFQLRVKRNKEAAPSARPDTEILTKKSRKKIFMEETFTKTVKKNLQLWLDTKFEDEFRTNSKRKSFIPIAEKTFEKLNWDLVF